MKLLSSKTSGKRKADTLSADKKTLSKTAKRVIIIVMCIAGLALVLSGGALAVLRWQIQPLYDYFFKPHVESLAQLPGKLPEGSSIIQNPEDPEGRPVFIGNNEADDEEIFFVTRNENKFTFLLMGIDEHANTDAIMIASLDVEESTLNIVTIPRDTLVNVSWNLKKVNSIHAFMRNKHRNADNTTELAMESTIEHIRNLLGFHVDFMITVNMNAFVRLIDTIGPISYNVRANVDVDGVVVPQGNQRLNGQQALAVMRSRHSYSNHAIGRDYAQQEFLMAVATSLFERRSSLRVDDLVSIFHRNVRTDIPLNNMLYFAREFLELSADRISFAMMPGVIDSVGRQSYITVLVDEWLEVVNRKLNPFDRDIDYDDLSVLTRGADRRLYVTDGSWQGDSDWGSNSLGPSNPSLTTDTSRPIQAPSNRRPPVVNDDGGNTNPVTGGTGDDYDDFDFYDDYDDYDDEYDDDDD